MIKRYATIGQIRQLLIERYEKHSVRSSFGWAIGEIEKNNMMEEWPVSESHKKVGLMTEEEFRHIIDRMPVDTEMILANPNQKLIPEEFTIPRNRDVVGFVHLPYVNDHMHIHNFFEINYVYSGKLKQQIAKEERILEEGELCIIAPNTIHNVQADGEQCLAISLMVRKSTFDTIFGNLLIQNDLLAIFLRNTLYRTDQSSYLLFRASNEDEQVKKIVQDIMVESNGMQKYANVYVNCLVQQLFYMLLREYSSTILYYGQDKWVDNQNNFSMILAYVQNNYRTVSLESVAKFFNYSESYLSRIFKRNMHETFNKVVQNLKMKKAEEYLMNTDMSIAWISEEIGYDSADYFTKNFKKYYGCSPSEYRKKREKDL